MIVHIGKLTENTFFGDLPLLKGTEIDVAKLDKYHYCALLCNGWWRVDKSLVEIAKEDAYSKPAIKKQEVKYEGI